MPTARNLILSARIYYRKKEEEKKLSRPHSPCKIGGVLCEKHAIGCKSDCEKWKKYQEEVAEDREKRNGAKSLDVSFYAYKAYSISHNNRTGGARSRKKNGGGKG